MIRCLDGNMCRNHSRWIHHTWSMLWNSFQMLTVSANLSDDILFLSTFMGMGIVDCKLLMF
jgi:hypothetical protein